MKGDKLLIEPHHRATAERISATVAPSMGARWVISVAGESGAGKSELGEALREAFEKRNVHAQVIGQDDYFVFPPKTNHEMRRRNLAQVGPYEVKLDYLDSNLRSFKRSEDPILKPEVDYDADSSRTIELSLADVDVLIVEGTYTSLLPQVDFRVFIDRTYRDTHADRVRRGRDPMEAFVEDVLDREHQVIREHRKMADCIVAKDFDDVTFTKEVPQ